MSTQGEAAESGAEPGGRRPGTPARRLGRLSLLTLGVVAMLAVVGAAVAAGALEPADRSPDDHASVTVGRTVHVPPYDITVKSVVWVDDLPGLYPTERGNRWLAVTATVRNTHDTSLLGGAELTRAVTLRGVPGLVEKPEPGTDRVKSSHRRLLRDATDLHPVQPGIPYEVAFLFEQHAATPPPEQVNVQLVAHTWRQDSLDKTMKWLDPEVAAGAGLPMRPSEQQRRWLADRPAEDAGRRTP